VVHTDIASERLQPPCTRGSTASRASRRLTAPSPPAKQACSRMRPRPSASIALTISLSPCWCVRDLDLRARFSLLKGGDLFPCEGFAFPRRGGPVNLAKEKEPSQGIHLPSRAYPTAGTRSESRQLNSIACRSISGSTCSVNRGRPGGKRLTASPAPRADSAHRSVHRPAGSSPG
jgi:hypothetical protein